MTVSNIQLDSIAQRLPLDAGAEARFALPFENMNIQLINLEKRNGKNLSRATKELQDVEKKGMVFIYSNLELRIFRKYKLNVCDKRVFFLGLQDRTTEYYTTFFSNNYGNITVPPIFSNVTNRSSKVHDFEIGKEEGEDADEKKQTLNQNLSSQNIKTTVDDNEGIAVVAAMYQLSRLDSNGTNKTISGITDVITNLDVKENQTNITFTSGKDIDNVDGHTLNFSNLTEIISRVANMNASDLQNHTTFEAKTNENTANANESVTLDDKNRKLTINEVKNNNDSDLRSNATLELNHGASVIDNYQYYYDDNLDGNISKEMTREAAIKSHTDLHINATSKLNTNQSTVNKNGHRLLNKDYCNTALYGEEHTMCKYKEDRPNDRCRKGGSEIIFRKITEQVNRRMNTCENSLFRIHKQIHFPV